MELGLVQKIDIDSEMQQAYLDYAMSVIVARALPDARDGLKPVHRRILYAMFDMGLRAESAYKKSARIVGEVLGKYHPHGDMAVYEAMARMAQDFSMRCLLVDGQGNFGSVDGDPPAAMRYTEARLAAPALNMLADILKNTVDFSPNFDDSLQEPQVLPAALPNLLVNGATGIAVGMSTSIPPHNLGEVVDALRFLLENWEKLDDINLEDLMQFIQGPDFPTGGVILQRGGEEELAQTYGSGRGQVLVQARAHLEEMERGRNRIIVTELPYMTNKSALIERIAELVREEKLEGIVDLRDESDRQGMRIVIELSKTADPEGVLQDLYKHTPMQSTFSIIMLALVDGEPRMLSLKQALRVYLDHRLEIIRRRSQHDLEKARQRAHILEGLRVALQNLDEIIDMIRKAPDVDTARLRLMKRFKLSEIQAQAILDMQLRRLAALERKKIELEYKEVLALIKDLEGLLRSPKKIRSMASDELLAVKEAFNDRRRTQIVHLKPGEKKTALLSAHEMQPDKKVWAMLSVEGLVARTFDEKPPRQSGSEAPVILALVNTRDVLYLVTENGEASALPVHSLPEAEKPGDGSPLHKVCALREDQLVTGMFSLPPKIERLPGWYVLSATHSGMIKKSALEELPGPASVPFVLMKVNEGDRLGFVRLTDGKSDVLMLSAQGMAIRYSEKEVRPMGLVAAGVMSIKLPAKDEVVGMDVLPKAGDVFMIASDGTAKRVPVDHFPKQGRYGQGVQAWKLPGNVKAAGLAIGKGTERVTILLAKFAPKMARLDEAPLQTRTARGKSVLEIKPGDSVTGIVEAWESRRPASGEAAVAAKKRSAGIKNETEVGIRQPTGRGAAKPAGQKSTAAKSTAPRKSAGKLPTTKAADSKTTEDAVKETMPATGLPGKGPSGKTLRGTKPAVKTNAGKMPAGKVQPGKATAEKPKASETTSARKPAAKKPAVKKPAVKKPADSADTSRVQKPGAIKTGAKKK